MIDECAKTECPDRVRLVANTAVAGLAPLVQQLREIVVGLSVYRPDPSDGANWVTYDSAVDDLYRALCALEGMAPAEEVGAGLG